MGALEQAFNDGAAADGARAFGYTHPQLFGPGITMGAPDDVSSFISTNKQLQVISGNGVSSTGATPTETTATSSETATATTPAQTAATTATTTTTTQATTTPTTTSLTSTSLTTTDQTTTQTTDPCVVNDQTSDVTLTVPSQSEHSEPAGGWSTKVPGDCVLYGGLGSAPYGWSAYLVQTATNTVISCHEDPQLGPPPGLPACPGDNMTGTVGNGSVDPPVFEPFDGQSSAPTWSIGVEVYSPGEGGSGSVSAHVDLVTGTPGQTSSQPVRPDALSRRCGGL